MPRSKNPLGRAAAVCAVSYIFASAAAPAAVTYKDLYTLGTPAGDTLVGVNGYQPAAGGQVVGTGSGPGGQTALLWTAGSRSGINLNPSGFTSSAAYGTSGTQQVGYGDIGSQRHALVWSGAAATAVDLNPAGFAYSTAYGVGGGQQVGEGYGAPTGLALHALLWSGTAGSAVDLHPTAFLFSTALGTDGVHQVGYAGDGNSNHAILWTGSAASAVDLNPAGFTTSNAYGTAGGEQVGLGYGPTTGDQTHAMLWTGSADSVVDLNPAGFRYSAAYATDGVRQVGYGIAAGNAEALFWNGDASHFVDLGAVLPDTFVASYGTQITGDTVYGYASDLNGNYHAISWDVTSVPEPGSLAGTALLAALLPRFRRSS